MLDDDGSVATPGVDAWRPLIVWIVDPEPVTRTGHRVTLERLGRCEVAWVGPDLDALVAALAEGLPPPRVVVSSYEADHEAVLSGLLAPRGTRVLYAVGGVDSVTAHRLLASGAAGIITKASPLPSLAAAVHAVPWNLLVTDPFVPRD